MATFYHATRTEPASYDPDPGEQTECARCHEALSLIEDFDEDTGRSCSYFGDDTLEDAERNRYCSIECMDEGPDGNPTGRPIAPDSADSPFDRLLERLAGPPPTHPVTGKLLRYRIPEGLNPACFCGECGLLLDEHGKCPEGCRS